MKKTFKKLLAILCVSAMTVSSFSADVFAAKDDNPVIVSPNGEPKKAESVAINETNFPDEYFRAYVSKNFDPNGTGYLSPEVIAKTTFISIKGAEFNEKYEIVNENEYRKIKSIKGIEYFTELGGLDCSFNSIESMDLSANTGLDYLNVFYNNITSLDLSHNTNLTVLNIEHTKLASIDLSHNTALVDVSVGLNELTSLDVSMLPNLNSLFCQASGLTTLDVTKNPKLTMLYCWGCLLTTLDVSKNPELTTLACDGNYLTSLDLSNNTKLQNLYAGYNGYKITVSSKNTFDLSKLPEGFDVSKASDWTGAKYNAEKGILYDITDDVVTYNYDCGGNKKVQFSLYVNRLLEGTYIYVGEGADEYAKEIDGAVSFDNFADAVTYINNAVKKKTADTAYNIVLLSDQIVSKAQTLPAIPITIMAPTTATKLVNLKVKSLTFKGRANIYRCFVEGDVKFTAKADKASGETYFLEYCIIKGKVTSNNTLSLLDCWEIIDAITTKGDLIIAFDDDLPLGVFDTCGKVTVGGDLKVKNGLFGNAISVGGNAVFENTIAGNKVTVKGKLTLLGESDISGAVSAGSISLKLS